MHLRRSTFLRNGVCYERLAVRNHGEQPLRVEIGLHVAADFADLFEVRGEVRARRGTLHPPVVGRPRSPWPIPASMSGGGRRGCASSRRRPG